MWAGDSFADGPAVCFAEVRKHQRDAADIFHRRSEVKNLLDGNFNDGSSTSRHYNGDNHGACAPVRTCLVCKQAHGGTR